MIPVQTRDIVTSGNLTGERIHMGIDPLAMSKIISIVTDLYSDPVEAIIREYSTNAWDSHVEAGQTRPIEVTLPSQFTPFFRVKDFGVGMSVDGVRDVFSKYGASTKDKSNDFNGMLGLGSKSALTYTSQFTVVAIKNGVKATVSVSRANDGTGVMQIVDTSATSEPNGVEIVIPVKYDRFFNDKANRFYSFWKPGTVLVNGNEPSLVKGTEVAPDIFSVRGLTGDFIVQGNVAYPVKDGLYNSGGYYRNFGVVAYVPNGSVAFAPSREALMYDSGTTAEVKRIREDFAAGLAASIQADLDDSKDAFEALTRFHGWKDMLGSALPQNLSYKQEEIPSYWHVSGYIFKPDAYRNQTTAVRQINYKVIMSDTAVIINDFTPDGTSAAHKAKLKTWAEDNDLDIDRFILVDKKFGGLWTEGVRTESWDVVKQVKVNKNATATGGARGKQSIKVWDSSTNWWKDADEIESDGAVYIISPADKMSQNDIALRNLMALEPDATVVLLGRNRWDKFKREVPEAVEFYSAIVSKYKGVALTILTDEDKEILDAASAGHKRDLLRFDASKVEDPAIVKAIETVRKANKITDTIKRYNSIRALLSSIHVYEAEYAQKAIANPLADYPLLPTGWSAPDKYNSHIYLYVNSVYKARQGS